MAKIYYNKLIRDNIQDIILGKGELCDVRPIVDNDEFHQELMKKVVEEAKALSMVRTKEDFLEEFSDLMLVLDTLNEYLQFTEEDVRQAMDKNIAAKGTYEKRCFLHWSDDKTYESNESPQGIKG